MQLKQEAIIIWVQFSAAGLYIHNVLLQTLAIIIDCMIIIEILAS